MNEMSRTTLQGQIARKVMFAYATNPVRPGYIEATLYALGDFDNQWALCLSAGLADYDVERSRLGLGASVPGELIAPFAQRFIDGVPLAEVRQTLEEGMRETLPGIVFEWEKPNER